MLKSLKKALGAKLGAVDGPIGHVKDFYFDDHDWAVRYVVVDSGTWIPGRRVLISPHAVGTLELNGKVVPVQLTREQIEKSPTVDFHKPISRQYEEEFYRYYNWPFYWQGGALWGVSDFPVTPPVGMITPPPGRSPSRRGGPDAHLRSVSTVVGYRVQGTDEEFGHVADFLMDDETWAIDDVVIDTGHWLSGRKVMISPFEIERISWSESHIIVAASRAAVEHAPAYEGS